jgi:hypothetical protein
VANVVLNWYCLVVLKCVLCVLCTVLCCTVQRSGSIRVYSIGTYTECMFDDEGRNDLKHEKNCMYPYKKGEKEGTE